LACAQRLLAGLLVLGSVAECPLRAQTNATKAARSPDRYLIILETSKSMQRRADAVVGTVWYLLGSGLDGQFRNGGTLGVWTFNQDLSAGNLPLQTWSSSAQKDITQRTITFLKGQKYGQRANFDKLAPALIRIVENSELITVVLISSGDSKIRGTPFDEQINAAYQQFREQQQKARMPFVTVLRARHGQIVDYVVNTPPWPLHLPPLPEESKSVEGPHGKPLEALHNAPASTVPPLIVSGKKPQPEPRLLPKPAPAPARTEVAATVTNEPPVVKLPEPAIPPAKVAKVEPAPVVPAKPVTEPVPVPQVVSVPQAETVKVPEAKATEPAPVKPEALPAPPAPVAKPQPVPAPKVLSEPKAETVKAPEVKVTETAPAKPDAVHPPPAPRPKPEPVISEQPKPTPAPGVKTVLAPAPAAIPEALPVSTPSAAVDQVVTSNSSALAPPPSSRSAPPAQSATAAPGESLLSTRNLWIAAVLLAVVVVGFAFLLARRSRPVPQGSLITRSFEREKRP
jgi:hypothetical protein